MFSIPGNPPIAELGGPAQRHVDVAHRRPQPRRGAAARHVPVRRESPGVLAVAGRRPDGAPLGLVARRVLRRQPRRQPPRRPSRAATWSTRTPWTSARRTCRESGHDAQPQRGAGRRTPTRDNLLRGFRGLATINQNTTEFWDLYHSIQTAFQRRFQNGFSFGANYTLGLVARREHRASDSACSTRPTARSRCAPIRRSTRN